MPRCIERSCGVWTRARPPPSKPVSSCLQYADPGVRRRYRRLVARLLADAPKLADTAALAKRLHRILRKEGDEPSHDVLTAAADTLLAGFAAKLSRDLAAVQAALDLPWTTSPVAGQVSRIKTIKRSMYDRAGFQLLRDRVLHVA